MLKKPDRSKFFHILFTIIFFLITGNIQSQEVKILRSVDEALSLALKNNSSIINATLDKLKADKKVSEVYSENLVPNLTLNSRYSRSFKKQVFNIAGERFEIGSDNSIINTIDVTESLPILGTPIFAGIRIAKYFARTKDENILLVENEVKNQVKKSYYTVLLAKAVVDVNAASLENAEANFEVVNSKYRGGVATEFDYLRARVRVDNGIPLLSKSQRNLEISQKSLLNAIGLKDQENIDVAGSLTYDSLEVWGNTESMISTISENFVAVRQLRLSRKINEELVKVDKANYLPKLYLFGQYALGASENDGRSLSQYGFYNTLNAGLGLQWDLNLFRNSYKVDQSEIEVRKTDEQISDTKQKLKLLSQSAIIAIEDAKERIVAQKRTVSLAERGLELANVSYRAGVLNQIEVQDSQQSLNESRLSYLQAIYDYQIAKAELERLLER
ncbi:MAG: TolC family protein [Ignavibacteria bacterium]